VAQVQRLAAQAGVAARFAPPMQVASHAPQLFTLVARVTSQPLAGLPSQSAKPVLQVKPQDPSVQVVVALAREGQAAMHAPQWLVLVLMFVSQPSVRLPLQSPKPAEQLQRLDVHPPAEFITPTAGHAAPVHAPQRAAVFVRSKHAL
jgi:hypothetical protein